MLPPFADVHGGVSPGVPQDDLPVLVKRRGSSFAGCAAHAYHRRPMSLETKERRSKFSPKVPYQHLEKEQCGGLEHSQGVFRTQGTEGVRHTVYEAS